MTPITFGLARGWANSPSSDDGSGPTHIAEGLRGRTADVPRTAQTRMIDDRDAPQLVCASLGREGSIECLFSLKEIPMCKSGLGDWGVLAFASTNGSTDHATLHDAGNELDAGTKMQETQMSFNLQYLRHTPGADYKTPAPE